MRKLLVLLLAALLMLLPARAEERPDIILFTVYQGVDGQMDAGCVDARGGLWGFVGSAEGWPEGPEEQSRYLKESGRLFHIRDLGGEELFELKGLIAAAEAGEGTPVPTGEDAGTEASFALRGGPDGTETVTLGKSGAESYENTDPDAQALYALAREWFPYVTCYESPLGPKGFEPIPAAELLGLDPEAVRDAEIRAYYVDCEEGLVELGTADESVREIVLRGVVTGKASASSVTGGTTAVLFYGEDGKCLGGFEIFDGLIAVSDGMYRVEVRS